MYKSVVYEGEKVLGEVEVYPQKPKDSEERRRWVEEVVMKGVIRISHLSALSERCPPLAVLHTISATGISLKMNSPPKSAQDSPLHQLHNCCIQNNKTAVVLLGDEELHLVAMHSRNTERQSCFWGFVVSAGLYNSCLDMLNVRCLGIVFDLDETLVVANTMRSFEDRMEALQRKITAEVEPQRIASMMAEFKRYQDDKIILKQYVDSDQVVENGKIIKAVPEIVPALSDNHLPIVRPLIRLPERNIILTRINPQIRDTSVLVRLRPAWEELRTYLMAKGRKRFEVYVCTMAERDYALEMWRLLDPELNLISSKELLNRIVCVKSGLRKSLFNVFQGGICHPKMALVIDDRLKVWDEKDQPRVHVVPAFAPYYAPQAEANNVIPVLCVARNVACSVRGGFFKEFDEGLLQKIPDISYENDTSSIPSPPDVSNHLGSEDDASASASNGNKDLLSFDGMADAEVERRLKEAMPASSTIPSTLTSAIQSTVANLDPRLISSLIASSASSIPMQTSQPSAIPYPGMQFQAPAASLVKPLNQVVHPERSFQCSPAREEGEVPESELDPDTRRRLLILQHGQDFRDVAIENPFPGRPSMQVSVPRAQSHGVWAPMEEEMSPRQLNRAVTREHPLDSDPVQMETHRPQHPSFYPKIDNSMPPGRLPHENQRFSKEAPVRNDRLRLNQTISNYHPFSGEDVSASRPSSSNREVDFESDRAAQSSPFPVAETPVGVLQDIATKCGTRVEFRPALVGSRDLQFLVEAWFAGDKVGEGIGRTRREAQRQAAQGCLKKLADNYLSCSKPDSGSVQGDPSRFYSGYANGVPGDTGSFGNNPSPKDDPASFSGGPQLTGLLDPRLEASRRSMGSVTALKEFCMMEGIGVNFLAPAPLNSMQQEIVAQVEVDGRVVADGVGSTWDEARMQAAENALRTLRTTKRKGSPRQMQGMSPNNKRPKPEFQRVFHRMPSATRYAKNAPPVP